MAVWLLVILAFAGVAYGLYAGHHCREAERRLRILAKDWQQLAQRLEDAECQLAETKAEAKAQIESGYREYEALAKATRMVANTP